MSRVVLVFPVASAQMSKQKHQGPLAFWIHQVVEYALGILMAYYAIHLPKPTLPLALGGVVVLLAATGDGPAAAFHLVPKALHRKLDLIIGVVIALIGGALFTKVGSGPSLLTMGGGLALLALSWQTNYAPKPVKPPRQLFAVRRPRRPARIRSAGATLSRGAKAEKAGRTAGRYAAVGVKVWKNRNK